MRSIGCPETSITASLRFVTSQKKSEERLQFSALNRSRYLSSFPESTFHHKVDRQPKEESLPFQHPASPLTIEVSVALFLWTEVDRREF